MFNATLSLDSKLTGVAIRPFHHAHPLDREGRHRLLFVANQPQTPDVKERPFIPAFPGRSSVRTSLDGLLLLASPSPGSYPGGCKQRES